MPNNNQGNERDRMSQGGGQRGRQGSTGESEELERDVQSGRQGRGGESEELERDVQSGQQGGFRGRMEGAEERQERTPQSSTVSNDELEDEDSESEDVDELEDEDDASSDIDSEQRR